MFPLHHVRKRMFQVEVSRLSCFELVALKAQLDEQIGEKRAEALKVQADGFVKQVEAAGFSAVEGVKALAPYVGVNSKRHGHEKYDRRTCPLLRLRQHREHVVRPRPPREVVG